MSKRVNVTLADFVFDELEKWADPQGRPTANWAAFLNETSIEDTKKRGEYLSRGKGRERLISEVGVKWQSHWS